jgi:hypothetical protein
MGHPDFRVDGRIFATLNEDETVGVVMLTPEQQKTFLEDHPAMFSPAAGAWGRGGSTRVHFAAAEEDIVGEAVTLAWQNKMAGATRTRTSRAKRPARSTPRRAAAESSRKTTRRR